MGRSNVRPGDMVRLAADPTALHLFYPANGNRIG
jgi:multiple sugar transport system ATP-binding protein